VEWFESNGMKVRELKTLPSYDGVYDKMIKEY